MTVALLIEHDGSKMKASSRRLVSAAARYSLPVTALVVGYCVDAIAQEAASCDGVDAVFLLDHPSCKHAPSELVAPWVASLSLTHLLAPANAYGKNLLPRIAALLDMSPIEAVQDILADRFYVRSMYAGNILCDVSTSDTVQCLTVVPTAFSPCGVSEQLAQIDRHDVPVDTYPSKQLSFRQADSSSPELATANCVMTIGRGVSPELIPRIKQLAKHYRAAIGATRAVVDAGLLPNECQVGQTGQVVAPDLYIAWGVSGAVQHLAGMKDSGLIVSINKDPGAAMNAFADLVLEADVADVLSDWEERFASDQKACYTHELEYEL